MHKIKQYVKSFVRSIKIWLNVYKDTLVTFVNDHKIIAFSLVSLLLLSFVSELALAILSLAVFLCLYLYMIYFYIRFIDYMYMQFMIKNAEH